MNPRNTCLTPESNFRGVCPSIAIFYTFKKKRNKETNKKKNHTHTNPPNAHTPTRTRTHTQTHPHTHVLFYLCFLGQRAHTTHPHKHTHQHTHTNTHTNTHTHTHTPTHIPTRTRTFFIFFFWGIRKKPELSMPPKKRSTRREQKPELSLSLVLPTYAKKNKTNEG